MPKPYQTSKRTPNKSSTPYHWHVTKDRIPPKTLRLSLRQTWREAAMALAAELTPELDEAERSLKGCVQGLGVGFGLP